MLKIGVLASGRGSNFQSIIDAMNSGKLRIEIAVLITDNRSAFAIERAKKHGISYLIMHPSEYRSRDEFFQEIAETLKKRGVGLVVLAGFMRIVGNQLVDAFPNMIMNIHPALLRGFPGLHAQRQAISYGVKISGCAVHFVDEGMDSGPVIVQACVPVEEEDDEETLSARILVMEHRCLPEAIRLFCEGRLIIDGRRVRILPGELVSPEL